jgi:hypothetical protein
MVPAVRPRELIRSVPVLGFGGSVDRATFVVDLTVDSTRRRTRNGFLTRTGTGTGTLDTAPLNLDNAHPATNYGALLSDPAPADPLDRWYETFKACANVSQTLGDQAFSRRSRLAGDGQ